MILALFHKLFTKENAASLVLCLVIILVILLTTDQSPQWIYQGF